MIQLTAKIVGAEQVQTWLGGAGSSAHAALKAEVDRIGLELLRRVKAGRLTGQSLKVQTGRLRRSINYKYRESGDTMTGSVGTNVIYGAFWELGPKKSTVSVKAHTRRDAGQIAAATRTTKSGKRKVGAKGKGHGTIMVKAHERRVTVQARPFLKPELDAMRYEIRERLKRVAVKGVRDGR